MLSVDSQIVSWGTATGSNKIETLVMFIELVVSAAAARLSIASVAVESVGRLVDSWPLSLFSRLVG